MCLYQVLSWPCTQVLDVKEERKAGNTAYAIYSIPKVNFTYF